MNLGSRGPVVIDTGVFGARLAPSRRLLTALYRPVLEAPADGYLFVTVAGLVYGAQAGRLGPRPAPAAGVRGWLGRDRLAWTAPHRRIGRVACLVRQDGAWPGQKEHEADVTNGGRGAICQPHQ
jgi:hypothetical protein